MKHIEVLIVEDNVKISKAHKLYVEKIEGYVVTGIANTIADARELIEVLEPDLVLLDIYLPEGNGMDFLEEMRGKNIDTDFILITAAKQIDLLHSALRGGVFDYMIKPVFFERFEESLTKYKEYKHKLEGIRDLDQEEVNSFFMVGAKESLSGGHDLPKGIDSVTLEQIISIFEETPEKAYSAEEAGEKIGVGRTTARKYLEHLITVGFLKVSLEYGSVGRPERKYCKSQ
jgi:response regulator of citrate/malate metabolism